MRSRCESIAKFLVVLVNLVAEEVLNVNARKMHCVALFRFGWPN